MKTRKWLQGALTFALIILLASIMLPISALALPPGTPGESAANPVTTDSEFTAAITAATTGDTIYIGDNITLASLKTISGKSITITSGNSGPYTLSRDIQGTLFTIGTGSSLTLSNIIIDGQKDSWTNNATTGSLILVQDSGELVLNDGAVLQNAQAPISGPTINNYRGSVIMNDGALIRNNTAPDGSRSGAGIFVTGQNAASFGIKGVFIMNGGTIEGNIAGLTNNSFGGGVAITTYATFVMNGGEIKDNFANRGGGVYVNDNSLFQMYDGARITGNTCTNIGGGICLFNGSCLFEMYGGEISGNKVIDNTPTTSSSLGGGVYIHRNNAATPSQMRMLGENCKITDNSVSGDTSNMGGGIYSNGGVLTIEAGEISGNSAGDPYTSTSVSNNGGGIGNTNGTFSMTGGLITQNSTEGYGGGIFNYNSASLIMSGGTISDNLAIDGGGIANIGSSTFTIGSLVEEDLTIAITGNQAIDDGGGIFTAAAYDLLYLTPYASVGFDGNTAGRLNTSPAASPVPAAQWQGTITSISPAFAGDKNTLVFNNYDINFDGEEILSFAVTYHANGGSGTAPIESDKFAGEEFLAANNTFTAPIGMQFAGWNTSADGTGTSYAAGAQVTMPEDNLNLYATWEPMDYSISYLELNGASNSNPASYTYGSGFALQDPGPREGYSFSGWYDAATGGTKVTLISNTDTGNKTLYAHWESTQAVSITVTFDTQGATTEVEPLLVVPGDVFGSLPVVSRVGFTFLGWFTALEGGTQITADTVVTSTTDLVLYALWEEEVSEETPQTSDTSNGSLWFLLAGTSLLGLCCLALANRRRKRQEML